MHCINKTNSNIRVQKASKGEPEEAESVQCLHINKRQ